MQQALGLIETVGLAAAYEAADTALKTANVSLIGYELSKGDGMVTVKIAGRVGAVEAGIKAAQMSAGLVNKVYSVKVIPRPSRNLDSMVFTDETVLYSDEAEEPSVNEQVVEGEAKEEISNVAETEESTENSNKVSIEAFVQTAVEKAAGEDILEEPEPDTQPDTGGDQAEAKSEHDTKASPIAPEMVEEQLFLQDDTVTCNICSDPACPRTKGEAKRRCLHYFKS